MPVPHIGRRARPQLNHEGSSKATPQRAHVVQLLGVEEDGIAGAQRRVHNGHRAVFSPGEELAADGTRWIREQDRHGQYTTAVSVAWLETEICASERLRPTLISMRLS